MTEQTDGTGVSRRAALAIGGATVASLAASAAGSPAEAVTPDGQQHEQLHELQRIGRLDGVRVVDAFYRALQGKDIDAFADLWTADAVYRVPVNPDGVPGELAGRETIVSAIGEFFTLFGEMRFTWEIEPMLDPRLTMATWTLDIEMLTGGRYQNRGVAIFRLERRREGTRIAEFTEYFDTAAFLGVFATKIGTARRFFDLLHEKDIEAWSRLWHEHGRILVPYPPEGFPTVVDGRAEILSSFQELFAVFETFDTEITGLYPVVDSDAICVEYKVHATLVNGTVYTNDNIAVFRFQDGLISAYHDYFDPRRFQEVIDALPE